MPSVAVPAGAARPDPFDDPEGHLAPGDQDTGRAARRGQEGTQERDPWHHQLPAGVSTCLCHLFLRPSWLRLPCGLSARHPAVGAQADREQYVRLPRLHTLPVLRQAAGAAHHGAGPLNAAADQGDHRDITWAGGDLRRHRLDHGEHADQRLRGGQGQGEGRDQEDCKKTRHLL